MNRQIPTGRDKGEANETIVWFWHEKLKRESDKERSRNRERNRDLIRGKKGTGGKRVNEVVREDEEQLGEGEEEKVT